MKIHILGLSGSPVKGGNNDIYLKKALKAAEDTGSEVTTDFFSIAGKKIKGCIHCNYCVNKQTKERPCSIKDDMDELYPKLTEADGFIFCTPTYIGRLSGQMACLFDRFRPLIHGPLFHGALRNKPAGSLTVIWVRHCGAEIALLTLQMAALTLDMLPVGLGIEGGQLGGTGVTSFGGTGEFDPDDKHLILKDDYGLDLANAMGRRVVEVAKLIKAGKEIVD